MAWLAKDISEDEYIFDIRPYKEDGCWYNPRGLAGNTIKLPRGSIEKLIGKEFKWNDNPVELKDEYPYRKNN